MTALGLNLIHDTQAHFFSAVPTKNMATLETATDTTKKSAIFFFFFEK
jgi:hypothetical protein